MLNSFVNRLFTASSFEADFPLIKMIDEGDEGAKKITMPDGIRYKVTHFPHYNYSVTDTGEVTTFVGLNNYLIFKHHHGLVCPTMQRKFY